MESTSLLVDTVSLNVLREEAIASPRLRMNRDMRDTPEDTSQRMLNSVEPGTVIPIHRHLTTSEVLCLLRGKIDVILYNDDGSELSRTRLDPSIGHYAFRIPLGAWHSVQSFESGSVFFEAKNGQYHPESDKDFLTIARMAGKH